MADNENLGVTTPVDPSDSVALTPEERDNQTIARLMGTPTEEAATSEETEETAASSGEDDGTESLGETADKEEEDDADELPDLTDEEIDAILEVAGERILKSERIRKQLEEEARAEADRRYEDRRKAESATQESERLIREGRTAVESIYDLYDKLHDSFQSALRGDEVDESVKFSRDDLMGHLGQFGAAAVAEARRNFDNAFASAFRKAVEVGGPLTEEEKPQVIGTVQTAQRIANDPKQGQAASIAHIFEENMVFTAKRAYAAGKKAAEEEFAKKREALKRVTGENSTRAAIAKIASTRKKLPTKPVATPAAEREAAPSMEAYKAAKAAGDYAKADEIARLMGLG